MDTRKLVEARTQLVEVPEQHVERQKHRMPFQLKAARTRLRCRAEGRSRRRRPEGPEASGAGRGRPAARGRTAKMAAGAEGRRPPATPPTPMLGSGDGARVASIQHHPAGFATPTAAY